MTGRPAGVWLIVLCLSAPAVAQEQEPAAAGDRPHPSGPMLRDAALREGRRLAAPGAARTLQTPSGRRKSRAVAVGALIGGLAGGAGGLVQPTHSNGEYVLGNSRVTSALSLAAAGAGVGALVGWAVDRARR